MSLNEREVHATLTSVLSLCLHSLPGDAPAKGKRGSSKAWLESAALHSGALILTYLCPWSPTHATVAFDFTTLSFSVMGGGVGEEMCPLTTTVGALNRRRVSTPGDVAKLPVLVGIEIERAAESIWPRRVGNPPQPPSSRRFVEGSLREALGVLAIYAGGGCISNSTPYLSHALEGLGLSLSLLLASLYSARAPLICRPVPPWLMAYSGGGSQGGVDGPFSQQSQVDTEALKREAIAPLPPLKFLAQHWPSVLPHLPHHSLLLLYWLAVLAPVRLVRQANTPAVDANTTTTAAAAATTTYLVIHGPPILPPSTPTPSIPPLPLPLWSTRDAAQHGIHSTPLFHGTATENVHSILNFGLRSLSGTRHEASGSIFGEGVYLAGDLGVSKEFAVRRGLGWGGWAEEVVVGGGDKDKDKDKVGGDGGIVVLPPCPPNTPTPLRVVLEVQGIHAPSNRYIKGGRDVTLERGASPPPGCYVVVTQATNLHITRVHILSEDGGHGGAVGAAGIAAAAGGAAAGAGAGTAAAPLQRKGGGDYKCSVPWAHWIVIGLLVAYVLIKGGLLEQILLHTSSSSGRDGGFNDQMDF